MHDHDEARTTSAPHTFPHPSYARHILRPFFEDAQRLLLFGPMLAANAAHLIMLSETGIIPATQAGRVLSALRQVEAAGPVSFEYAPAVEDLFFAVEGRLIALAGPEAGGNLQIARSRNDLDAAMCRLLLRDRLLAALGQTLDLRERLIAFASEHVETLMPGITHTQPAQPTTLAHYLAGVLGPLERDTARLRATYARVNQSPLGAAAFTTTGFPIDRELIAQLLGFVDVVENGYDAVGGSDCMIEPMTTLTILASGLSRFVHDLLIWARSEVGILRIGDEFVQISSIMPQKRNPVVLEHVRARIGYVHGDAATVTTMLHSSAFGDTADINDQIYVPLARAFDALGGVLELLTAVFATATINRDLLSQRAGLGFTTSTELADTLVRDHGLPFRSAHGVAAATVKLAIARGLEASQVTPALVDEAAVAIIGRPLDLTGEALQSALDPWTFVRRRSLPGGPAPEAMQHSLAVHLSVLQSDRAWLAEERTRLLEADLDRERRAAQLIARAAASIGQDLT
ncbi:MAG: argininosuccinate lyase [Thermomicrobiales bacterium]